MEAGKEVKKIPMTFGDALDALEADEVIKKRDARRACTRSSCTTSATSGSAICATVTDWDVNEYLDILP